MHRSSGCKHYIKRAMLLGCCVRAACHSRVAAVKSGGEGQKLDCEVRERVRVVCQTQSQFACDGGVCGVVVV